MNASGKGRAYRQSKGVEKAHTPEDLAGLFVARTNAGDVEGLVALYEEGAVLAISQNTVALGRDAIRDFYTDLLAKRPISEPGEQQPTLVSEVLVLTSTRLVGAQSPLKLLGGSLTERGSGF